MPAWRHFKQLPKTSHQKQPTKTTYPKKPFTLERFKMVLGGHIFQRRLPRARSLSTGCGVKLKNIPAWRHFRQLKNIIKKNLPKTSHQKQPTQKKHSHVGAFQNGVRWSYFSTQTPQAEPKRRVWS